tara:strand:- start:973 stop:1299 length:327 start_codon:yes stop_codon:yes gene_type:complete
MEYTKTFRIGVWHLNNSRDAGWAETPAAWPVGYTQVATIVAGDLDDAYRITNFIDDEDDWWENDWLETGVRSCSVGDVFEIDGVGHRIAYVGFEAVSDHPGIESGGAR